MYETSRNFRRAELLGICRRSPHQIVNLYRAAADLDPCEPLPENLTMSQVIEAILEHEKGDSFSSGVLRAIAG
jgi:hypothetical protein